MSRALLHSDKILSDELTSVRTLRVASIASPEQPRLQKTSDIPRIDDLYRLGAGKLIRPSARQTADPNRPDLKIADRDEALGRKVCRLRYGRKRYSITIFKVARGTRSCSRLSSRTGPAISGTL